MAKKPEWLLRSRLTMLVLEVGLACSAYLLMLVAWVALALDQGVLLTLDHEAPYVIHTYSTPTLDTAMRLITMLGSLWMLAPILLAVVVQLWHGRYYAHAVFMALAAAGGSGLNHTLKLVFQRDRPTLPWSVPMETYSFPSGHAMTSLIFYLGLALVILSVRGRRWGAVAVLLATMLTVLVGLSRVYLGYHYVSDVIAGYSAGLGWLMTVAAVFEVRRSVVVPRSGVEDSAA